ncbi:MAG: type II secretion system F family protein [Chloroflexi bacterium]|nr:type II secretion system F family protein [Chloroflexota bacterium]
MLDLLVAGSIFGFVTSAIFAALQMRGSTALAAQARLERVTGNLPYADWAGSSVALRGNRMSSISWVEKMLANRDFAHGLDLTLIRAGWRMRVSELIATCFLTGVFVFFAITMFLGSIVIAAVAGAFSLYVPYFLLKRAAKRRISKIEKQLAETLGLIANALRAGFGLMQAIGQAARQMEEPIAGELSQFVRDTQIGSSVEEAATNFGHRIGSYDLDIVVTAILVQRNVGGNLSEILDGVAHTIRERERIRGEIQTLIAEQKMTGIVIGLIPPGVAGLFFILNRSYMMVLVETNVGRVTVGVALVMELLGAWMIKKIINIDV